MVVALAVSASSCDLPRRILGVPDDCEPRDVVVPTSDELFAGTWHGVLDDWPSSGDRRDVTLSVAATYDTESRYAVAGPFEVNAAPALALTGTVSGGCFERYLPASGSALTPASLPPSVLLSAEVRDADTLVWRVWADPMAFTPDAQDRATVELWVERVDASANVVFSTPVTVTRTELP